MFTDNIFACLIGFQLGLAVFQNVIGHSFNFEQKNKLDEEEESSKTEETTTVEEKIDADSTKTDSNTKAATDSIADESEAKADEQSTA